MYVVSENRTIQGGTEHTAALSQKGAKYLETSFNCGASLMTTILNIYRSVSVSICRSFGLECSVVAQVRLKEVKCVAFLCHAV